MAKNKKPQLSPEEQARAIQRATAQDWIGITDIREGITYLKNGQIVSGVRILPMSITLKTLDEQVTVINTLARQYDTLMFPFQLASTYKPVDMTTYINTLNNLLKTENNEMRKELLRSQLQHATETACVDDLADILYYGIVSEKNNSPKNIAFLREKLSRLERAFTSIGMQALKMTDTELKAMWQAYFRKNSLKFEDVLKGASPITSLKEAN